MEEGRLYTFINGQMNNPDIPKRKADQLAMDNAGTILLKSTAKWAMGGLLISSIISYNFLRPKQRFFGLLGGTIISIGIGVARPPWQDMLTPFLKLDTELGDSVRAKASELFPPNHPINNGTYLRNSNEANTKFDGGSEGLFSDKGEDIFSKVGNFYSPKDRSKEAKYYSKDVYDEDQEDDDYFAPRKDEEIIYNTPQDQSDKS